MGYTHYFELKNAPTEKQIKKVLQEIDDCLKALPNYRKRLHNGMGEGEPIFNENEIYFNGDASTGEDHEAFMVNFNTFKWNFCKTARKPYDVVVCLCLVALKVNFQDSFEFSSDGGLDGIRPAFNHYRKHVGTDYQLRQLVKKD